MTPSAAPSHHPSSHATRLLGALRAVDSLPVVADVRREVIDRAQRPRASAGALTPLVASDIGLAVAVLRAAGDRGADKPRSIAEAVEVLGIDAVREVAEALTPFSPFDTEDAWEEEICRARMHALATARMARRVAEMLPSGSADEVETAALLHDVGKLVLARVDGERIDDAAVLGGPARRFAREQEALGVDHATIGGLVARRWGLSTDVARGIERHHAPDASGLAAIVKVADLLVRYLAGDRVNWREVEDAAAAAGLPREVVADVVRGAPTPAAGRVVEYRQAEPCPLSGRQLDIVRGLARGLQYKQVANELGLTTSTVRTHVHAAYQRVGATDRAQMVLLAAKRGWIAPIADAA